MLIERYQRFTWLNNAAFLNNMVYENAVIEIMKNVPVNISHVTLLF